MFLRNRLKYALTGNEVLKIVKQRLIKVDGKVRTEVNYPAGFMGNSDSLDMGLDATKPVFGVSEKARLQRLARKENDNFTCSNLSIGMTLSKMRITKALISHPRRLVGAFVVRKPPKTSFLSPGPIYVQINKILHKLACIRPV